MKLLFRTILSAIMLLYSCEGTKDKHKANKGLKKIVLDSLLSDELNFYIEEYPIPKESNYYYQISFDEGKFMLMRLGFPAPEEKNAELKGMFYFKDSIPISIFDKKNVLNSNYYNNFFNKDLEHKIFTSDYNKSFDESFPPIWKYKITNSKPVLIRKDTIWKEWK